MALDQPRELLVGGRVLLLEKEPLPVLVELRGGREGGRTAAEEAAAGKKEDDGSGTECPSPERPSPRVA
jgi:hypothetical protein